MTERYEALRWWNTLTVEEKKHFAKVYVNRQWQSFTGREIQNIFEKIIK